MTVYSLIKIYQYFGKPHCLHLLSTHRNEAASFQNTMVDVHQARRHHTSLVTNLRCVIPVVCQINQTIRCMCISSDTTIY